MKLRMIRSSFCAALIGAAASVGSPIADAKPVLYARWDASGSSSAPGGVTYTLVVEGWGDDGTGGPPDRGRYTNGGRGGAGKSKISDNKVSYPKTPGNGCTIPPNIPKAKGIPPGTTRWPFFVSPKLTAQDQAAFRDLMKVLNADQKARGRQFRFVEVSAEKDARMFFTPPIPGDLELPPGKDSVGKTIGSRDGYILGSGTAVSPSTDPDYSAARANHDVPHALGVGDQPDIDPNYPNIMEDGVAKADKTRRIDPCTLARIDANLNQKQDTSK